MWIDPPSLSFHSPLPYFSLTLSYILLFYLLQPFLYFSPQFLPSSLKVALDGGTRPGDTLQILPLALAQPPNPRSFTSHSVLRGHPSLTHRVGFFQGHSFRKDNNWNCNFFKKKICISDEKYQAHTIYIYICI